MYIGISIIYVAIDIIVLLSQNDGSACHVIFIIIIKIVMVAFRPYF